MPTSKREETNYPLASSWTLYLDDGHFRGITSEEDFFAKMTVLGHVDSVKSFWKYHNYCNGVLSASKETFNLRMFKTGVKPIWEDKANKYGGRWVIRCPSNLDTTLRIWRELIIAAAGGMRDQPKDICGCVLSCKAAKKRSGGKRTNKIEVWVPSNPRGGTKKFREIKSKIKALCRSDDVHIDYTPHDPNLADAAPPPSPSSFTSKVSTSPKTPSKKSLRASAQASSASKAQSKNVHSTPKKLPNPRQVQSATPTFKTKPRTRISVQQDDYQPWFHPIVVSSPTTPDLGPSRVMRGSSAPSSAPSLGLSSSAMTRNHSFPRSLGDTMHPQVQLEMTSDSSDSDYDDRKRFNNSEPNTRHSYSGYPGLNKQDSHDFYYYQDFQGQMLQVPNSPNQKKMQTLSGRGSYVDMRHSGFQRPYHANAYNPRYEGQSPAFQQQQQQPQQPPGGALDALHDLICRTRLRSM